MKRFLAILICMTLGTAMAYAQPGPQDGGGPPPGRQGGPRGGGPGMGGPGMGPGMDGPGGRPDGMGPGGPGQGGPGAMGPMRQFEIMRGYLEIVDRYSKISSDPTTAGIAAVVSAAEVLKPRGSDAAIEYFNKLLPEVKNESVARAIRAQLAELYKAAGQQDKSLEQLRTLITGSNEEKK